MNSRIIIFKRAWICILLLTVMNTPLSAQMFSVEDSSPGESGIPTSSLSAGWEFGDFTYRGDPDVAGVNRYDFNMGIFRIHFENPGINMYMGLAGGLTGSSGQSFFNIGAVLHNDFILYRNEELRLLLPVQINTDLVRTKRDLSTQQFQQTAFQVGGGLGLWKRFSERFHTDIRLIPNYGFSNSQGAFIGGTVFSLEGKLRIHLQRLIGNQGFLIGYDYRHRSYSVNAEIFNYNLQGHTISIGLTF